MKKSNCVWSAQNNAFFPIAYLADYKSAGWDLTDIVDVSEDIYSEYTQHYEHKVRGISNTGMPCWIDAPIIELTITHEVSAAK